MVATAAAAHHIVSGVGSVLLDVRTTCEYNDMAELVLSDA